MRYTDASPHGTREQGSSAVRQPAAAKPTKRNGKVGSRFSEREIQLKGGSARSSASVNCWTSAAAASSGGGCNITIAGFGQEKKKSWDRITKAF